MVVMCHVYEHWRENPLWITETGFSHVDWGFALCMFIDPEDQMSHHHICKQPSKKCRFLALRSSLQFDSVIPFLMKLPYCPQGSHIVLKAAILSSRQLHCPQGCSIHDSLPLSCQ